MEIEVKLRYNNKKAIVKLLKNSNFKLIENVKIKDSYFGKGHMSMSDVNQLYRIREINNQSCELTYKYKINESGKITKRKEINVKIDNPSNGRIILLSLGCQLIKENYSEKEIWENKDIILEFITNLKPQKIKFIEIEGKTNKSINKIIDLLGKYVRPVGEKIFDGNSS